MTAIRAAENPLVWALVDDRAGNRSQCLGVAEALGFPHETKTLRYRKLAGLPNALIGASFKGLDRKSRAQLTPPWPDVVIAAGRRTAPVARKIGRLSGGRCFLAQIMQPGAGANEFGLIVQPSHDRKRAGGNVLAVTGSPHGLTAATLEAAADRWRADFESLPKPWIALIVGGSTRRRKFTPAMARELGRRASRMASRAGGSLLVTTSRRTGNVTDALLAAVNAPARVHRWPGDEQGDKQGGGDNPYVGYLALADAVIVTGDSASMCSEACATAAPVYIFAPPALTVAKHARLHAELYEKGYARPLAGALGPWSHPPLNAAEDVAAAIRDRLGL